VVLVVVVIVVLGIMGTAKTAILKKCCKIKADIARKFFFSSSIC
jgi:putative effector of murein hydrolase